MSTDSGRYFKPQYQGFEWGEREGSFYDGAYIYYMNDADSVSQVGRWRVDEGGNSSAETPEIHEPAAGVRLSLDGRSVEAILVHVDPSFGSEWEARLLDMRGSEIERRHVEGGTTVRFDARALPSGAYAVMLRRAGRVDVLRLVLVK